MRAIAGQFVFLVAASVVATLTATYLINNVRAVRNFTGPL